MNGGWGISYEIALKWMPLDLTDDKSTLVQVMAWCRQATSHYLSQCWPRSLSPYGVTRPQWVNIKWKSFVSFDMQYLFAHKTCTIQIGTLYKKEETFRKKKVSPRKAIYDITYTHTYIPIFASAHMWGANAIPRICTCTYVHNLMNTCTYTRINDTFMSR